MCVCWFGGNLEVAATDEHVHLYTVGGLGFLDRVVDRDEIAMGTSFDRHEHRALSGVRF